MKKFLFLAFFCCLFSATMQADVLFTKKNGTAISQQEYNTLYSIMLKHQFPTNIMFGVYDENEIEAMRNDIEKQLSTNGIGVSFIPKTLYELLSLKFIAENLDTIEQVADGILSRQIVKEYDDYWPYKEIQEPKKSVDYERFNLIIRLENPKITSVQDWWKFWREAIKPGNYELIVRSPQIMQLHLIINNAIIAMLEKHKINFSGQLSDYLAALKTIDFKAVSNMLFDASMASAGATILTMASLQSDMTKCESHGNVSFVLDLHIVEQAIKTEWYAHKTNHFVLYRGTHGLERDINQMFLLKYPQCFRANYSLSYGSTLFGGLLFGLLGSAYTHILMKDYGYGLLIDQREYLEHGLINNMFFIPPLTTLLNLLGTSEFFHSRTKMPDIKDVPGMICFGTDIESQRLTQPSLLQIKAEAPEKAHEIFDMIPQYIRDNHIDIKV